MQNFLYSGYEPSAGYSSLLWRRPTTNPVNGGMGTLPINQPTTNPVMGQQDNPIVDNWWGRPVATPRRGSLGAIPVYGPGRSVPLSALGNYGLY